MSEIEIKEVQSKSDLKSFIKYPFKLYKGNEYWVPPINQDEMETFQPSNNPAFEYAESKQWLARKGNQIVGRVAGIKHNLEFKEHRKVRFGWIDFIDDYEVSKKLIDTIEQWARKFGAEIVHGPMGFNDFDFEGMLVEGFDSLPTIATIYNHPYYKKHLEKLGYKKAVDWVEFEYDFRGNYKIPERLRTISSYVSKRYNLRLIEFKRKKDILNIFNPFFDAVNESYKTLYGYHELTNAEASRIKEKFFKFLSVKYLSGVIDNDGSIVAFAVTMPSLSKAFQKANGKLFPFGFLHILKAIYSCKIMDLYLIGAIPEYKEKGASAMVFLDISEKFIKENVTTLRFNPTLEDHQKLLGNWGSIFGQNFLEQDKIKRRRCYTKNLSK